MKGIRAFTGVAISSALLGLSASANAQEFREGVDANADGSLDLEEFVMAMGEREFSMHDANGDDVMSAEEWLANGAEYRRMTLERFNVDNDEEMSPGEIVEVFIWIFGNRDNDRDGVLSPGEAPPFFLANGPQSGADR